MADKKDTKGSTTTGKIFNPLSGGGTNTTETSKTTPLNVQTSGKLDPSAAKEMAANIKSENIGIMGKFEELYENATGVKIGGTGITPTMAATGESPKVNVPDLPESNFNLPQLIENGRTYIDHVFEMSTPFSKRELGKINSLISSLFFDVKSEYNFFVDLYEESIGKVVYPESLLPSLYVFCSELQNENTDRKETIFRQHISLNDSIKSVFKDITNNKGEKIGEKDKGDYFYKYALASTRVSLAALEDLLLKFKNIVFPISNIDLINKFNEKAESFPMYFDLTFSTDNTVEFVKMLEESLLYSSLVKDIISERYAAEPLKFEQINSSMSVRPGGIVSNTSEYEKSTLRTWDLDEWLRDVFSGEEIERNGNGKPFVLLGDKVDEIDITSSPDYQLYKSLMAIVMAGKCKDIVDSHLRTYEDLISGKKAYNETFFYRIEKRDSGTSEVLQNFYIPNSSNMEIYRFIDTQVKYNKKYDYVVYAYQIVVGNEYAYYLDDVGYASANVDVLNYPSIRIVEVEYLRFSSRIMDSPPVFPDVNIIPYKGMSTQVLFNFNSNVGDYKLEPILIEQEDQAVIDAIREAQMLDYNELLRYKTDDIVSFFEVFRLKTKPKRYKDFVGNKIQTIKTDISSISAQKASSASFVDSIVPNQKYYYMFRAIDNHGHFSNPTPIYEFQLVEQDGVVYPLMKVLHVDELSDEASYVKSFKKYIHIVPTYDNIIYNDPRGAFNSIPSILGIKNHSLGINSSGLWGKNFKIRLTSKRTGKKLDLNLKFGYENYEAHEE